MAADSISKRRFEYVVQRLQNHFSGVDLSQSSPDREIPACRIRVSHRKVVPWEYTPFVMLCFQEGIESISESDFKQVVEKGVASIKRILQNPPVGEFSYQGNICLGYAVRFEYQGPERRSGVDRRTRPGEKPSGTTSQGASAGLEDERVTERRSRERRGDLLSEGLS